MNDTPGQVVIQQGMRGTDILQSSLSIPDANLDEPQLNEFRKIETIHLNANEQKLLNYSQIPFLKMID